MTNFLEKPNIFSPLLINTTKCYKCVYINEESSSSSKTKSFIRGIRDW